MYSRRRPSVRAYINMTVSAILKDETFAIAIHPGLVVLGSFLLIEYVFFLLYLSLQNYLLNPVCLLVIKTGPFSGT